LSQNELVNEIEKVIYGYDNENFIAFGI